MAPPTPKRKKTSATTSTSTSSTSSRPTTPLALVPSVLATPAMPPDWMKCYDEVRRSLNSFQKFPVVGNSLEYKTIVELLAPTEVVSVEKVVNPGLWQTYTNARKEMIRRKTDDLNLLAKLGLDAMELMHCSNLAINSNRDPLLETDAGKYSPNEALLFHCTRDKNNLDNILLQGLDERLSSSFGGMLGKGIYFSDDPRKSLQYAGGTGVILVFAVLLGDCLSMKRAVNGARHFVREPEKQKAEKRNCDDQFFDSITSRPAVANEYVIFNRHQCCPLYEVKVNHWSTGTMPRRIKGDNFSTFRGATPPIAWKPFRGANFYMPNQALDSSWPFYATSVFKKMGVVPLPDNLGQNSQSNLLIMGKDGSSIVDREDLVSDTTTKDQLVTLVKLGFFDDAKNREALVRYDYNLEQAVNFLLDSDVKLQSPPGTPSPGPTSTVVSGTQKDKLGNEGQRKRKLDEAGDIPDQLANLALNSSKTSPAPSQVLPELEECLICCNEYKSFSHSPGLWKELKCSHRLCLNCFQRVETSGTTMSGVRHTSVRCPFCQGIIGIEVGNCPKGKMTVTTQSECCDGYPGVGSIRIKYVVNSGRYSLNRVAYLPNNTEGKKVLKLLQTAWDRKLCFTIGNSITLGMQNMLVWNIHHKTALRGGVQAHGYPDPGYLERVKLELKAYAIE